MALKHLFASSKAAASDSTQAGGPDWNADHVVDNAGLNMVVATSDPAAPASGKFIFVARAFAGRAMAAVLGALGMLTILQPHLALKGWSMWRPVPGGTTPSVIGASALAATGTATAASYGTTSLHARSSRLDYLVTAAATNAVAGFRAAAADMRYRVTDGFHAIFRFAPATGNATTTKRCFVGMSIATAAPTDVQPSSLTDICGVGYDAADANWQCFFNDNSGTATRVDTGIARPAADRDGVFTVGIYAPPGGGSITVRIVNEVSGVAFETTASTDLMATTTSAGPRGYSSAGGTSSVIGLTLFGGYIETDI